MKTSDFVKKATFVRKADRWDTLRNLSSKPETGRLLPGKSSYVIEKTVELVKADYIAFESDLLSDQDFIIENVDLMHVDRDGVWHCILVSQAFSSVGILVNAEGYDYPRYTAIYES